MITLLAFALPLLAYLSLPSTMWNFDGVACAAAIELGWRTYFFHANHLIYGFLGFLFWKGFASHLGMSGALPALQLLTALFSAVGLIGVFKLFTAILDDRKVALVLSLALAVSAAFWVWSIEAQVYSLGFMALAWATYVLLYTHNPRKYVGVGILHAMAVLGHILHALWIIPALYWMKGQKGARPYLTTLALFTLVPYLLVLVLVVVPGRDWPHILLWLKGSAGITPDRSWQWHSVGWSGPWVWLKSFAPAWWGSFWPYAQRPVPAWAWVMTSLSIALFLLLIVKGTLQGEKTTVGFSWLWVGVYGLFLWTWEPATLCYRMTDVLPLGILMALGLSGWRKPVRLPIAALLLMSLASVNLATRTLAMSRAELNPVYEETLHLAQTTPPNSIYFVRGSLPWIYLLYFTGRAAWNMAMFSPNHLAQMMEHEKRVRPVYIESEKGWAKVS